MSVRLLARVAILNVMMNFVIQSLEKITIELNSLFRSKYVLPAGLPSSFSMTGRLLLTGMLAVNPD